VQHKHAVLDDWCRQLQRDPAEIERSVSPAKGANLDAYLEVGTTHFIFGMGEPWDFGPVEEALKWREGK